MLDNNIYTRAIIQVKTNVPTHCQSPKLMYIPKVKYCILGTIK